MKHKEAVIHFFTFPYDASLVCQTLVFSRSETSLSAPGNSLRSASFRLQPGEYFVHLDACVIARHSESPSQLLSERKSN